MFEPDQYLLDLIELQQRERPSFSNFIPGKNDEALAVLCAMAAGRGPRFLYLYGPQGAGLSHLLEAYLPGVHDAPYPVPIFRSDVLHYAVDDIGDLDVGFQRQLLALQNAVYASPNARLVCAGRKHPQALGIATEICSRLNLGPVYAIQPLNEEDCFRELRRQAALRGIVMTKQIERWMASFLSRDMRTLTHVMDVSNELALYSKRPVNLNVIKEAAILLGELPVPELKE